jgi:hypothetical protein
MNFIIKNIKTIIAAIVVAFTLAWIAHDRTPAPDVGQTIIAPPAKEVRELPKAPAKMTKPIKVYSGSSTKEKLNLPAAVVEDEKQQVIESIKIEGEQPVTVTGVVNTETGDTQMFIRTDPKPWLAWDDHGGAGVYAGYKNGDLALRLEAHQELFRIKDVHIGVQGSLDQRLNQAVALDSYVGLGAEYRW